MVKRCPGLSVAMVTQVTNLPTAALTQRYVGAEVRAIRVTLNPCWPIWPIRPAMDRLA
jgi:hypothetical protein